jgi:hypothetical protein
MPSVPFLKLAPGNTVLCGGFPPVGALSPQAGKKPLAKLPGSAPICTLASVRNEQAPVAKRPAALPPEFEERVMLTIHEFNGAATRLADWLTTHRAFFTP